jgi:anti-anti-sigma factor
VDPVVWRLLGAIDMSNARQIETAVVEGTDPRTVAVVLDLEDVTFIDTAGVQALMRVETHMRARGGRLIVVAGRWEVQQLCRLLRVDQILQLVDTFEAALDRLAGMGPGAVPEGAGVRGVHSRAGRPAGKVAGPTSH